MLTPPSASIFKHWCWNQFKKKKKNPSCEYLNKARIGNEKVWFMKQEPNILNSIINCDFLRSSVDETLI